MTEMERSTLLMGSIMASQLLLKNNYTLISMTGSGNVCMQDKKTLLFIQRTLFNIYM